MLQKLEHNTSKTITPGHNSPLGATLTPEGVNFAVSSVYASQIYLQLFDQNNKLTDTIKIENKHDNIWHVFVKGIKAGQLYGYRAVGDYDPALGKRFNHNKLLIDPYSKAINGKIINVNDLIFAYDINSSGKDLTADLRDNSHVMPKSIIIDDTFDWEGDSRLNIPMQEIIIYENHVKGFTAHPSSGVSSPGTYLGFIEKIDYLKELGINAVELMPVHEHFVSDLLIKKGLINFWGYNTVGFFASEYSYSSRTAPGCQVTEFKQMIKELHKAGIEVYIDVVFNHTGEGNELGPTISFKGLDNGTYYSLISNPENMEGEPYRYYLNDTGTGNTMNVEDPVVLRLILDSLRYWTDMMHVDGFRFDLASILARVKGDFSRNSLFFEAIAKDPVLSKVKMIAEPWDLKTYQVGNFPPNWSEWNGKYRDTARSFLRGDALQAREMAKRLTGSADLYGTYRKPFNSINFITCHDGFTLRDLYTYNIKHNEANKEDNKDGFNDNRSWNCGFEGETDDLTINNLRAKMIKNALCMLILSAGTPMLLYGDEVKRTQKGNNNAYCQDNDITWFNWNDFETHKENFEFCRKLITLRKHYPFFRRTYFFVNGTEEGKTAPEIIWFGRHLDPPNWDSHSLKTVFYQLAGSANSLASGNYYLFLIFNMRHICTTVHLPQHEGLKWYRMIDTSRQAGEDFRSHNKEKMLRNQLEHRASARCINVLLAK